MNTDIQLSLTVEEVNAVLQTLGNLPTSSGAYPLMMKIKGQAEAAVSAKRPEPSERAFAQLASYGGSTE